MRVRADAGRAPECSPGGVGTSSPGPYLSQSSQRYRDTRTLSLQQAREKEKEREREREREMPRGRRERRVKVRARRTRTKAFLLLAHSAALWLCASRRTGRGILLPFGTPVPRAVT